MIADFDPEDAFDAGDVPAHQLNTLELVIADLRAFPDDPRRDFRRTDALRIVSYLERRRGVSRSRLRHIRLDLEAM